MTGGKDFYAALGISREDAGDAEKLKKAYKKAALKFHPDRKGGDAEKFKRVGLAYDTLSDANKRAVYDRYGEEGLKAGFVPPEARAEAGAAPGGARGGRAGGGFPGGGFSTSGGFPGAGGGFHEFTGADAEDLFSRLFGGGMGGMGGVGGMGGMGGMGGDPFGGAFSSTGGIGSKRRRPENVIELSLTLEELFRGTKRDLSYRRQVRSGASMAERDETLSLDIKRGWKDGTKITFERKGHEDPGTGEAADLVVVIKERAHAFLKREGDNLIYEVPSISLRSALVGWKVKFDHIDGQSVSIELDEPTPAGFTHSVRGRGMPNQKTGARGDLILRVNGVSFPRKLTAKQKNLLKECFPASGAA